VRQTRYYQLLLFREDIESIVNLFVSSCQDVEMLIDHMPVSTDKLVFPFEKQRIRSFFIRGYEDMTVAYRTGERRRLVQLKITPLSAVIAISDKAPRSLWKVELQTSRLLSSRTQITLPSLLVRTACFVVLGNEAILSYILYTAHTFMHIAVDILLVALWLALGFWGLRATNRICLVNLDAQSIVMVRKREEVLKTIFVVIGAVLIGALVMWLKKNS